MVAKIELEEAGVRRKSYQLMAAILEVSARPYNGILRFNYRKDSHFPKPYGHFLYESLYVNFCWAKRQEFVRFHINIFSGYLVSQTLRAPVGAIKTEITVLRDEVVDVSRWIAHCLADRKNHTSPVRWAEEEHKDMSGYRFPYLSYVWSAEAESRLEKIREEK